MGGKVWSTEEERIFWEVVIPRSPNAANPADRTLSWKECVDLMNESIGLGARREYTSTMLYEHHYQGIKNGVDSAKANRFFKKYMRDVEWYKDHKSPPPASPPATSTAEDPEISSLLDAARPKARRPRKATQPRERKQQRQPTAPVGDKPEHFHDTAEGARSQSFTSAYREQPYPPRYPVPTPNNAQDIRGRDRHQASTPTRAGLFLARDIEPAGGGYWRLAPRPQQEEPALPPPALPSTVPPALPPVLPPAPRYFATSYERVSTNAHEQAPRQAAEEAGGQWNGSLPPIHEMFPTLGFEHRGLPPLRPSDAPDLTRKRSVPDHGEFEPAPKRRPLPDLCGEYQTENLQRPRQLGPRGN
ncbi:hypothetical protein NM208_g13439 [Fusarium decemcellulare]|uniref:Uncharacterized protein n=1 Tax=Fusarium decemcellulare TaxID=57161 RepID=A0ACC1RNC5_9HYPO|nr:hypothetical protein NM208_g13439 [Fusarium decemcellulare]